MSSNQIPAGFTLHSKYVIKLDKAPHFIDFKCTIIHRNIPFKWTRSSITLDDFRICFPSGSGLKIVNTNEIVSMSGNEWKLVDNNVYSVIEKGKFF